MRKLSILFVFSVFLVSASAAQTNDINIIPKPRSVQLGEGDFTLDAQTRIVARSSDKQTAKFLQEILKTSHGIEPKIVARASGKVTEIALSTGDNASTENDGYRIEVTSDRATLSAPSSDGLFYAVQTFRQLIPVDAKGSAAVPTVTIDDANRFRYRGMHLDPSRHFWPVSFVKKYIDLMSQYKFNTFHWHLTDDQGWRIEIKKYPKLTEIGSKRPETVKERNLSPYIGDGIPVEGFYTQEDIKEVVKYAKERHITVIPEIELPGHASAALTAYPQFGCKSDYQYKVQTTWGIFKEVFCPTEETFKFLEDVLTETIALFPDSPYIHIGGDEVLKDHWKESAFVQELKQKHNLKDEHEVQSYFVQRMEKFVNSKGKKIIGWDEILEGGLAPNATVMSWRGMKGGIEAAKAKHDVIMTPTDFVYFDYGQGDPAYEPLNIGSYVPLSKVYSFDPVPPELTAEEAKYVIGGQANLWTEYIKTPSHVEYMVFPRMLALSEVLWSEPDSKNYADFMVRLGAHFARLDKQNVNYRIPEPAGLTNVIVGNDGAAVIELTKTTPGSKIIYTVDGAPPDDNSAEYTKPIRIELQPGGMTELKTVVITPASRRSAIYSAVIVRRDMREPDKTDAAKPGVNFKFEVPNENPDLKSAAEVGETRSILLNQFAQRFDLKKPFTATLDGYFKVPADGIYELQLDTTWDAALYLGDEKLIDDAGTKDSKKRSVIVPLKAGLHNISLRYNHRGGDHNFRFRWGIKGQGLRQAYGAEFVH